MLLDKKIIIKWNRNNKKYYENLGYNYTKIRDEFEVKVDELMHSCTVDVNVDCDYCGKEYKMKYNKYYSRVLHNINGVNKCACKECEYFKTSESTFAKYGVENFSQLEKRKIHNGNVHRKHTIEEVRKLFEAEGYKLITDVYINNEQKLEYECPEHGIQYITLRHFLMGQRCKGCFYENNSGENNNMWNGGTTEINHYLRGLLDDWKFQSLKRFDFKCCISGDKGALQIHHDYPFRDIVQDVFKKLNLEIKYQINDYKDEELEQITELFLEISMNNLGYPLTTELHKEFHNTYGLWAEKSDFWEFYNNKINNIPINKKIISKNHFKSRKVKCIDLDYEFNSASECSRKSLEFFGEKMTQTSISYACRTGKLYKGHEFIYLN